MGASLLVFLALGIPEPPLDVTLVEPAYRGWLFPEDERIRLAVQAPADSGLSYEATLGAGEAIRDFAGKVFAGKLSDAREIVLDVSALPPGAYRLSLTLKAAAGSSHTSEFKLTKLSADEAGGVAAHVDRHGRLIWRGKPFFVLGWYSDGSLERLRRIGGSPFNAVLDYGLTARPIEESRRYLEEAERLGVAVILCVNDVYPSATIRQTLGSWTGNDAILEGLVSSLRDSPAAIAWYNNDELPLEKVSEARDHYRKIRRLDPSRPQLMVHFKKGGLRAFQDAADVLGMDHYPIPRGTPKDFADALRGFTEEITVPRPVWAVIQNFGWYQHRDADGPVLPGDLETPRARLPTPKEWREGRPPTFDELRAMTYLALVNGARGILYWCLYNADFLPDREERWQFSRQLAAEIRGLEAILLEPGARRIEFSDAAIQASAVVHDGSLYVLSVNASAEAVRAQLDLDAPASSTTVEVLLERRRVRLSDGGRLADFFPPYARHVYRIPRPAAE